HSAHFPISGGEAELWNNRDTSGGGHQRTGEGERAATATGHLAMRAATLSFARDLRVAAHSLIRTPGLAIAVVLTLSLGIGANAAIFTLVRGALLKSLVNRDADRLLYFMQSASGLGDEHSTISVPELHALRTSFNTLTA